MNNSGRILNRLPAHYQADNEKSNLYKFIKAIGMSIELVEEDINEILLSRWVSTAGRKEIERLAELFKVDLSDDGGIEEHRAQIVANVNDLVNGRGTPASIRRLIKTIPGFDPEIIENPLCETSSVMKFIKPGERWEMFCNSVIDADPIVHFRVLNHLYNPTITNLTNNLSVSYNGLLRKGSKITIYPDGKAALTGIDVSDRITIRPEGKYLKLPKGRSVWVYKDDTAKFNENGIVEDGRGMIELKMEWTEREPANVMVKVPGDSGNERLKKEIREILEQVRTAGVKFKIELSNNTD